MKLQRHTGTGKLLRSVSGKLAGDCCCDESDVTCNDCDPKLKEEYTITITMSSAACDGEFAVSDVLVWVSGCVWWGEYYTMQWIDAALGWQLSFLGLCGIQTNPFVPQNIQPCDPTGVYSIYPNGCSPACLATAGTAVIS